MSQDDERGIVRGERDLRNSALPAAAPSEAETEEVRALVRDLPVATNSKERKQRDQAKLYHAKCRSYTERGLRTRHKANQQERADLARAARKHSSVGADAAWADVFDGQRVTPAVIKRNRPAKARAPTAPAQSTSRYASIDTWIQDQELIGDFGTGETRSNCQPPKRQTACHDTRESGRQWKFDQNVAPQVKAAMDRWRYQHNMGVKKSALNTYTQFAGEVERLSAQKSPDLNAVEVAIANRDDAASVIREVYGNQADEVFEGFSRPVGQCASTSSGQSKLRTKISYAAAVASDVKPPTLEESVSVPAASSPSSATPAPATPAAKPQLKFTVTTWPTEPVAVASAPDPKGKEKLRDAVQPDAPIVLIDAANIKRGVVNVLHPVHVPPHPADKDHAPPLPPDNYFDHPPRADKDHAPPPPAPFICDPPPPPHPHPDPEPEHIRPKPKKAILRGIELKKSVLKKIAHSKGYTHVEHTMAVFDGQRDDRLVCNRNIAMVKEEHQVGLVKFGISRLWLTFFGIFALMIAASSLAIEACIVYTTGVGGYFPSYARGLFPVVAHPQVSAFLRLVLTSCQVYLFYRAALINRMLNPSTVHYYRYVATGVAALTALKMAHFNVPLSVVTILEFVAMFSSMSRTRIKYYYSPHALSMLLLEMRALHVNPDVLRSNAYMQVRRLTSCLPISDVDHCTVIDGTVQLLVDILNNTEPDFTIGRGLRGTFLPLTSAT